MRRKMARSAPPPPFGPPGVAVVRAASLACQNAVKAQKFVPPEPSEESRFIHRTKARRPSRRPQRHKQDARPHAPRPPPGRVVTEAMGDQVGTANRSVLKLLPRTPVLLGGV